MPLSSLREYIIFKKFNIGLKTQVVNGKLILQGGGNIINLVLIMTSNDAIEKCLPSGKSKDFSKVSTYVQS